MAFGAASPRLNLGENMKDPDGKYSQLLLYSFSVVDNLIAIRELGILTEEEDKLLSDVFEAHGKLNSTLADRVEEMEKQEQGEMN